jgi:hypothetical protein
VLSNVLYRGVSTSTNASSIGGPAIRQ